MQYCIAGYYCESKFFQHWKNSFQQIFLRLLSQQDRRNTFFLPENVRISLLPAENFCKASLNLQISRKFGLHRKNTRYTAPVRISSDKLNPTLIGWATYISPGCLVQIINFGKIPQANLILVDKHGANLYLCNKCYIANGFNWNMGP